MIQLTRLNGEKIIINVDLIEIMEETPDTVVTLTTGKKYVVKERAQEIIQEVVRFKKRTSLNLKR